MGPDVDKEIEEELQHLEEQDDGHAQVEAQRAAKAGNQDAELKKFTVLIYVFLLLMLVPTEYFFFCVTDLTLSVWK